MADIVCQVFNRDDQVEFVWSSGGAFFKPYGVRGQQLKALRRAAGATRKTLETLVVAQNEAGDSPAPWDLAYQLAQAGAELFVNLIPSTDQTATNVLRWLNGIKRYNMPALEIILEDRANDPNATLSIPWNLVYDERPSQHKLAFEQAQEHEHEHWRPFWGLRYNLTCGRRVESLRWKPAWREPRVVAVIDPVVHDSLKPEQRKALDQFLQQENLTPIESCDDLEAALEQGYPRLLYWLGHASPDHLSLGKEQIVPDKLRSLLSSFGDRDRPEGMLVFLNACRTGEVGEKSGSFLATLHSFDFVAGSIVTERHTIDNFANRFGLEFLQGFLQQGQPLGVLLHRLRLDNTPLGLLYAAYCPPEIHVPISGEPESKPPPKIHLISDAGGVVMGPAAAPPLGPAAVEVPELPKRPYPSLAYYDRLDRLLFSGRDADVVRFAATLDRPDTRILILHGESGIGKSSFLRAGVIPYLEEECVGYRFLRDGEGQVVIIHAANDPVGRLAEGLLEMTERPLEYPTPTGDGRTIPLRPVLDEALGTKADAAALRAALLADPGRLATLLERLSAHMPHALVLVLDQAEELFTLAKKPEEIDARDQALRLLQRVADVRADVKVIVSLRTEYYGRLLDHLRAGRRDLTGVRDDLLRDFSKPALIEAIERPTLEIPLVGGQPPRASGTASPTPSGWLRRSPTGC